MPEYLAKSTLLYLNTGNMDDPDTNGFALAAKTATNGLAQIEPIVNVVGAGTGPADDGGVWSGAGQPEATLALTINRNAVDVARIEMEAATTAVYALHIALLDLQGNLRRFVAIADAHKIDVAEDGTCAYRNPEDVPEGAGDPGLDRLTLTIKQILKLATLADLDARGSLQRVTSNTPSTSDSADPSVLQQVNDSLDQALEDRRSIGESAALWLSAQSPTWEDYLNGGGGDESTNKLLDYVLQTWTTLGPGNHSLITLLRDGPVAVAASATQGVVTKLFDPKKIAGRVLGPVGIGQLVLEGVLGIFDLYTEADDGTTKVDTNGGPEVRVVDEGLAKVASQFYPAHGDQDHDGSGTLADLAYYQRVTDASADGTDWQAQASQTRAELQAWVDGQSETSTSSADVAYAESLIAELDAALGE